MSRKPSAGKKTNLSQFGLLDMNLDDGEDEPMDLSDDDIDLEAELAAISGGGGRQKPRKPTRAPAANLDAMIAESLKDIPSNEEDSGDDDDDPDLLNELHELAIDDDEAPVPPPRVSRPAPAPPGSDASPANSTVSLIQERIANYTLAEKNAKESGETSRARRFARGLKSLNDLLKQAKTGKPIKDEDIPPPVSLGKPTVPQASAPAPELIATPIIPDPVPSAPEPEDEPPSLPEPVGPPPPPPVESRTTELDPEKQKGVQIILKRKEEFKAAALSSKHAGDKAMALEYLKVVKQFDMVLEAYKAGQEMDLSELPTPQAIEAMVRSQGKEDAQTQNSADPVPSPPSAETAEVVTPATLEEGLRQRLAAFQKQEAKAKEEGNTSKARRMARIVKQYQDAIRMHAAGKPIAVDELPAPAGHGPLPTADGASAAVRPSPAARPAPSIPSTPSTASTGSGASLRHEKQLALLLHRQKQFKEAAIKAKKAGDIEQAKEYLRAAKGFDSVIDAARGGLIVDLKSLPLPPKAKTQLENTFDIVASEDCGPSDDVSTISADDDDVLMRIQRQLINQLKLCISNRDHNQAMGQIAEANRFDHLAITVQQDLDVIALAKRLGRDPPKFHYESRQFSVVQCNTDVNENELELTIVRGIAYNVPNPKDIDTYVKFEFPYPQETPVIDRTALIKDTNSPEYLAVFPLAINRSARPCLRVFKRHGIKFEVYSRGGWFRSDTLVGSATVKLAPLETQVTLHEAFPLMDGRRPAGGSLEIKLRVRTPLLQPQLEHSTHRWLVIDH